MKLPIRLISLMILGTPAAWSRVPLKSTTPVSIPVRVQEDARWTPKELNKIVPPDLASVGHTSDTGLIANKFGDQAIQSWFRSPEVQASPLGRTATQVQETLKTEVNVRSGGQKGKKAVDHKISFQVLALQNATKVEYKGWVNAAWNYDARQKSTRVELSEKVGQNKDLTLSHTASTTNDLSAVGLRWSW